MDMVDSALKTLGLALVKYNKHIKKHYRKNILEQPFFFPGKSRDEEIRDR